MIHSLKTPVECKTHVTAKYIIITSACREKDGLLEIIVCLQEEKAGDYEGKGN